MIKIDTDAWLGIIIIVLNALPFVFKKPNFVIITGVISMILMGLRMGGIF